MRPRLAHVRQLQVRVVRDVAAVVELRGILITKSSTLLWPAVAGRRPRLSIHCRVARVRPSDHRVQRRRAAVRSLAVALGAGGAAQLT